MYMPRLLISELGNIKSMKVIYVGNNNIGIINMRDSMRCLICKPKNESWKDIKFVVGKVYDVDTVNYGIDNKYTKLIKIKPRGSKE